MSTQIQWRRGTTAQHSVFIGALGEVTVDTDKDTLVVHDNSTVGGFPVARESALNTHTARTDNPHGVTKLQVGLGNAENTADADKVVASAGKLTTSRTISLSGDATGSVSFDGSGDADIVVAVGNDTHTHAFGNITGKPDTLAGYGITDADTSAQVTTKINTAVGAIDLSSKQDTLVSGTNIKTVNSSSILGSGNLALLTSINPVITGSITEQVYNLTGTAINPENGTIQYKTVSANTTFTETLTTGQSVILRLIGASSYTITFPTITWVGAAAPVLTANCAIVLWKEQSTLYGAFVGTLV